MLFSDCYYNRHGNFISLWLYFSDNHNSEPVNTVTTPAMATTALPSTTTSELSTLLTVTDGSTTTTFTMADLQSMLTTIGYGGEIEQNGTILGPYPYTGVALTSILNAVGGITAGQSVKITARFFFFFRSVTYPGLSNRQISGCATGRGRPATVQGKPKRRSGCQWLDPDDHRSLRHKRSRRRIGSELGWCNRSNWCRYGIAVIGGVTGALKGRVGGKPGALEGNPREGCPGQVAVEIIGERTAPLATTVKAPLTKPKLWFEALNVPWLTVMVFFWWPPTG